MPTYTVVVDKLSKRRIIPSKLPDDNNVVGVVNKGCVISAEEVPAKKVPNASLGKWYKDSDGYYYWGGGLIKNK